MPAKLLSRWGLLGLAVMMSTLAGCKRGATPTAIRPVSGTVKLDGQPLANAKITFLPFRALGADGHSLPISTATTDDSGKYTLAINEQTPGAVVGWHHVLVSKPKDNPRSTPTPLPNKLPFLEIREVIPETIPSFYNSETILTYQVPPTGSVTADWLLTRIDPLLLEK